MKRRLKSVLCLLLCLAMLLPFASLSVFAAARVATVGGLSAVSKSAQSVTLSWNKVKNASGYQLCSLNRETGKWIIEYSGAKTSFTDKGLSPGTVYTYRVRAFSKSGKKTTYGLFSPQKSALTRPSAQKNC